eukprot:Plantae.Rhodophyta-Purpureofilum_apyrenoidigerum.ctg14009.p1 GENE.Plantae.Rhodophyta-Purpureofilum_apyrenoidigerum.ctg14009~~Plantae.Rhodophyta-Purpureofilum_apyrenoidigerum.ctg14009.p1  ORF type:complete len:618 (+),score=113.24 Plantae.Rhodophyta-Purpureofilum_apyrenoidigerum.ctg14009:115-1968(+)
MAAYRSWLRALQIAPVALFTTPLSISTVAFAESITDEETEEIRSLLRKYYASLEEEQLERKGDGGRSPLPVQTPPSERSLEKQTKEYTDRTAIEQNARAALQKYYRNRAQDVIANYKKQMIEKGEEAPKVLPQEQEPAQRKTSKSVLKAFPEDGGDVSVPYVIVGGGTAAYSAIQAIHARDTNASVLLITEEPHPPYNRTPLSKERWHSEDEDLTYIDFMGKKRHLVYTYGASVDQGRSSILANAKVTKVDPSEKTILTQDGKKIEYQKLLIATGGKPRVPDVVHADLISSSISDRVLTFRTVNDFKALDKLTRDSKTRKVTIFGGGFLGAELACSLHRLEKERGFQTALLFAEPGPLYKVIPRYLSEFLAEKLSSNGINVQSSTVITGASPTDGEHKISLKTLSFDDESVETDLVVVAVGIEPETEIAVDAGLEIDEKNGGIVVNAELLAQDDIYAAGDVASFWDRALGRRRVEHWDHALVSGRIAGDNMAGGKSKYGLQSMFWCDLSSIGVSFEAVGLLDSKLDAVGVWNLERKSHFQKFPGSFSRNAYKQGIVWYLRDKRVVGALLWNMPQKAFERAREVVDKKTDIKQDKDLEKLIELPKCEYNLFVNREQSR